MSSFILDYFNYRIVAQYLDRFAEGLGNTLIATGVSFVLSFVLGTIMAIIMFTQWKVLRSLIQGYVTFIRSTPLLVQIYLVYFGLPVLLPFTAKWPEMWLGIAALVINCTPYMSEIIRTGIGSVPRGQVEAAKAVGMSYGQRLIHIVLPQAFANVIPPVLGQTAVLIKDTSLLSLITVFEFTSAGLLLNSERVRPNESFLTIAAGYLAIYCVMLFLSHQVKKKLAGPAWAAKADMMIEYYWKLTVSVMPFLWQGFKETFTVSLVAILAGSLIGTVIGIIRSYRIPVLTQIFGAYVHVLRGTPFLVQLYVFYFVLPNTGIEWLSWDSSTAAFVALSLYTSCYVSEIVSSAIDAVPRGQWEAATAVGMNQLQKLWHVILPQALKLTIAPMSSVYVIIIKSTAILSVIGIAELTRQGEVSMLRFPRDVLFIYGLIALVYFIYCYPILKFSKWAENKISGSQRLSLD